MISSIRNIIIFVIALSVLIPCMSMAEDDLLTASEVIKKQRKVYIEKMMELTPQENEAFWSLYAEYESGLSKLRGQRIELATTFMRGHANLSDEQAVDMVILGPEAPNQDAILFDITLCSSKGFMSPCALS